MSSTVRFAIVSGTADDSAPLFSSNRLLNASPSVRPRETWNPGSANGCSEAKTDSWHGKSHCNSVWERRQG
jgi:hypothetical protein